VNKNIVTLTFTSIGHALMHMFAAFYFIIVLAIEDEWKISYDELIRLWTVGALLVGLGAIPAGWLSDKWSRSGMMLIMFIGLGFSSIICGFSENKTILFIGLTFLGLSCSIYHPVAISWVVNLSNKTGRALGINGIFGGIGIGFGTLFAGYLIDKFNWQTAFILPGLISIVIGLLLFIAILFGFISIQNSSIKKPIENFTRENLILIAMILLFAMFALGFVFQILQTSAPKMIDLRLKDSFNISKMQVGFSVAFIYGFTGLTTLLGGIMADYFSLKKIYLLGIIAQIPCYYFIASYSGISLIVVCFLAVMFNSGILSAENMLLAKLTPQKYHGMIYGLKFILAFGAGPLAVYYVSKVYEYTNEFIILFLSCSIILLITATLTFFLPINENKINR
tara:strand:- start:25161 stop:26342 length:1182 start_codon:yes stop_codon:yes gene_type:complete